MADSRMPGPLCHAGRPLRVEDGTLCRTSTSLPGPRGTASEAIARMSTADKLLEAAKRTTPRLPAEMREEFAALFAPLNISITAGVLALWASSHAFGLGQIIDLGLLTVSTISLGWTIGTCLRELANFVQLAARSQTESDLDRAADSLAQVVVMVGVEAFVSLIQKAGSKFGRGPRAAGAGLPHEYFGSSLSKWLEVLGRPKAPPLVRQRLETALKFFQERLPKRSASQVKGYLRGMDLSLEVREVTLKRGTQVVAYGEPGRPGLFYTRPGTALDRLGIADGDRQFLRFRLKEDVQVLESTATGIADNWTAGRVPTFSTGDKSLAGGGGTQYIIPDAARLLEPM